MRNFFGSERGYVLILTLIFMPVFIGIGLLVIDIGRGNNAQQDHQAAADALALAGARELDGRSDSMTRAKAAMTQISNTVSFLTVNPSTSTQTLSYTTDSTTPFNVIFLRAIPTKTNADPASMVDDDKPIDLAFAQANVANTGEEAEYVYVFSRTDSLRSFFFNPLTRLTEDVPVGAVAVATLNRSTCDLAPIFMCNPFVGTQNGATAKEKLLSAFTSGALHGRMIKLSANPNNAKPGPGNVGYLRTLGNGAPQLEAALAGVPYPECVTLTPTVETQPGAVTSAANGFNTRFDIYNGNNGASSASGPFPPAENVRKGWRSNSGAVGCVSNPADLDTTLTPVFSDNRDAATAELGVAYADVMRDGPWNVFESITVPVKTGPNQSSDITYAPYWPTLYPKATFGIIGASDPITATERENIRNRVSSDPTKDPSRYDVYKYEMTHDAQGNPTSDINASLVGTVGSLQVVSEEKAYKQCYTNPSPPAYVNDRRTMFVAVVDCAREDISTTGASEVPVDLLAKVFLVNPLRATGNNPGSQSFDFEIIDVSEGSNGGIEDFIRDDAVLVR